MSFSLESPFNVATEESEHSCRSSLKQIVVLVPLNNYFMDSSFLRAGKYL